MVFYWGLGLWAGHSVLGEMAGAEHYVRVHAECVADTAAREQASASLAAEAELGAAVAAAGAHTTDRLNAAIHFT